MGVLIGPGGWEKHQQLINGGDVYLAPESIYDVATGTESGRIKMPSSLESRSLKNP